MIEKDDSMRSIRPGILGLAVLLALAAVWVFAGIVRAQDTQPPTDDQVNDVAKELYCPVCENITLDICPTQACAQWRDLIRKKLAEGWSKEKIQNYFAEQYGDRVLAVPPLQGFNWFFYGALVVLLALAVVIYLRVVHNMKIKTTPVRTNAPDAPDAKQEAYLKQVEEALQRREKNG